MTKTTFAIALAIAALIVLPPIEAGEIHEAAAAGDAAKVAVLITADPSLVNLKTPTGKTPLHVAAFAKQTAVLRLLRDHQADLEARDNYGRTPLVLAAREMAGVEVVRTLLDLGANIESLDQYGDSALTLAAWRGSADVVALLLERGAPIPTKMRNTRGLAGVVERGLDDLFFRLVEDGADPAEPSLITAAAAGGSLRIMELLLTRGLDVNRRDENGWSPLHYAADMGRRPMIDLLLTKGADVGARNRRGQSAWNVAEENEDQEMMVLLAARGVPQGPPLFPELRGPYLGQKRPGRRAEVFASGIVGGRYGLHGVPVFSPDGTEAFWSVMVPPRGESYSGDRTLVSRLENGRWTSPRRAIFSGTPLEDVPFFHPSGRLLYDMARRPLPEASASRKENIWVWEKGRGGWRNPRPLDAAVNELPQHWQFSVDRAGNVYFSTTIEGSIGGNDIYVSRLVKGHYQKPENLGAQVNSPSGDDMPFITPDGRTLLFSRDMDIHVSFLTSEGKWTKGRKLGPEVNTRGMEVLPSLSPDGTILFFSRSQGAYWVDAVVVEELRAVELARFEKKSAAEELEPIVTAGDITKARERFDAMRGDAAYFVDEGDLNALGYRLLREQRNPAAAEAVLEMNTHAFPASWNAWDSFAEACSFRDRKAAIAHYAKSVELNPANENGKAALSRLRGYGLDEAGECREAVRFTAGSTTGLRGPYLGQEPPGRVPRVFAPGIVSTANAFEFSITFTPDGKEMYFTRREPEKPNTLMVSRLGPDGWTAPEEAAFAKGTASNEPHVTPDGRRLYFGSMREQYGIWYVERTADGSWSEPRLHGPGMYVSVSSRGDLYLTDVTDYAGGVTVNPKLGERFAWPRRLGGGVNSPSPAAHAFIAPDESYIVFDSYNRPGGQGGEGDLWVCFRQPDGSWGEAQNLGSTINTPATNFCPSVSPDGKYLFYGTNRDIYWVSAAILDELRHRPGGP